MTQNSFTRRSKKYFLVQIIHLFVVLNYLKNFVFHPINHLFVDDWIILKDFSLNNYGFNASNLTSYNGHPLFFSRILFFFVTETLRLNISTIAFVFFALYTLLLYFFSFKITRAMHNKDWIRVGIIIIGLNLNQYQNFVMPICWPWIISLMIFYVAFLVPINNLHAPNYLFLSFLLLISPQIFSLGFILPIGLILTILVTATRKKLTMKKIGLMFTSMFSVLLSYFVSIQGNEDVYEKTFGINPLYDNPLGALTFILSSLGAPFTPASRYATTISTVFGILIFTLVLLIHIRNKQQATSNAKNLIIYGLIFHLLQLLARFDGSRDSTNIVNQPRYTTGGLILIMGIFLAYAPEVLNKRKFFAVYLMLSVMSIAGVKTSWDFSQIRGDASKNIENCLNNYGYQNQVCLDMLNPGTKILSIAEFTNALEYVSRRHAK